MYIIEVQLLVPPSLVPTSFGEVYSPERGFRRTVATIEIAFTKVETVTTMISTAEYPPLPQKPVGGVVHPLEIYLPTTLHKENPSVVIRSI
jgi:hypothetical protein